MSSAADWTAQQLTEFSAVFDGDDDEHRLAVAGERARTAFGADLVVVEVGGIVRATTYDGSPPDPDLLLLARSGGDATLPAITAPVVRPDGDDRIVVARRGEGFGDTERALLTSMGRNLGVALDLAAARAELARRQRELDHLFRIQRAISERVPIMEVLDAICESAAELLVDTIVALRLVEAAGDTATMVAVVGPTGRLERTDDRIPLGEGVAGRSISENRFLIADDYQRDPMGSPNWVSVGVTTMMATPVRQNGRAVGTLVACSWRPGRRFSEEEQHLLQSLAEHGSLAFNDASAIDVIQRSLERAVHDSHHDQLTGLANRKQAIDTLEEWVASATGTTVLFIDLDRFKSINDAYGHSAGDEILRAVAARLAEVTRVDDLVARLSGDEFVVIVRAPDEGTMTDLATRIADALRFTATVGLRQLPVSASVGCARHVAGESAEDVVANADLAMYRAKEQGGGRVVLFDSAMREARTAELTLEREIRFAIEHGELVLHFQPVVDLATSRLVGAEALVRWNHPTQGLLPPSAFVDAAEGAGIMGLIDGTSLRTALAHLRQWEREGRLPADFRVSVNVSARQFQDRALIDAVAAEITDGMSADRVWLEITETAMMRDVDRSLATMHALRELGVHLAVDDFGTGWSSLAYLKQFPVEALKIDQSFVDGVCDDPDDAAIVEATIRLAGALGLGTIAEGVETRPQAEELRRMGCQLVQGFLYARPLEPDVFAQRWLPPVSDDAWPGAARGVAAP